MLKSSFKGEKLIRKPFSIISLSVIYLVSPLAILVFNAAINMVPLVGYGSIIFRLNLFDSLILILYVVVGISIFLVKKWGWWVIIASSSIMIIYNLISLFQNPFASLLLILLMNLVLFAVTLFFFRKHIIAPYFNPRLRWWEQDQRYRIDIFLKLLGINRNVIISDLSEGGCYIFVDFLIEKGSEHLVLIKCGSFHITLKARIMRIAKEPGRYYGYGLMFHKIEDVEREGLKHLLKKLKSFSPNEGDGIDSDEKRNTMRFLIGNDLYVSFDNDTSPAQLIDISRSGCSIGSAIDLQTGQQCLFHFKIRQISHSVQTKIIWKKSHSDHTYYGLKFIDPDRSTKKTLNQLISYMSKLGAKKRTRDKVNYNLRCDEKIKRTPYVLVGFLKDLFKRKIP